MKTRKETAQLIRESIALAIDSLKEEISEKRYGETAADDKTRAEAILALAEAFRKTR